MGQLPPGLYETLVDTRLATVLDGIERSLLDIGPVGADEAHDLLARAIEERTRQALRSIGGDRNERLRRQVELANRVLSLLASDRESGTDDGDYLETPARKLLAVLEPVEPPRIAKAPPSPAIPLRASDLLVNARHDRSLASVINDELRSADRVDLLCSFVKWSGVRIVESALKDHLARRPGSVRILTTTYMGATEARAIEALVDMGANVRVSYDRGTTRLHAKAWLLHRNSGFSTAFIGSSNLSASAVLDGLEWNVRLSHSDNAAILARFATTFEQYWADPAFCEYDSDAFVAAIQQTKRDRAAPLLRFDLAPRPHQARILEELEVERENGYSRNLVVAATGTGKTVVAALDYRRLRQQLDRSRLLFVAHRKEILEQSMNTFRVALRDGGFGERLGGGQQPTAWDHVFANIQSLTPKVVSALKPDAFDVVVVDEFHHAAANSYDAILQHLAPKVLLGLTATPERSDGRDVLGWFDGRIASEIRLWEALDQGLLCPFQYFGVGNGPDLTGVKWSRGRYDVRAVSDAYQADRMFALRVLQETQAKVGDIAQMKALGFCVDIAHASFMADVFREHGINAQVVSGQTSQQDREAALRDLAADSGGVQILFSVDLFNEGVDVPAVDTILFLRPTESASLFLQQLGRGLRAAEGKAVCTVLDFIGHAHRRFRFDLRYRAIVGGTRRDVERQLRDGFPALPGGCVIQLDEAARSAVLENVRASLRAGREGLIEDLRGLAAEDSRVSLPTFLERAGAELEDVYTGGPWCWTELKRRAGVATGPKTSWDPPVERGIGRMLHVDDHRIERFSEIVGRDRPPAGNPDDPFQRMLFILLGQNRTPYSEIDSFWRELWARDWLLQEIRELLVVLGERRRRRTRPLSGRFSALPLRLHASYTRNEVFAAFDERTKNDMVKTGQAGIHNVKSWTTELLFVELEKNEGDYSPTTLYNDFPVTPHRFRWESQSAAHEDTPAGQRYLAAVPGSEQDVLLFVRLRRRDGRGERMPYICLGLCDYGGHTGAKPMRIDWRLREPMPPGFFQEAKMTGG